MRAFHVPLLIHLGAEDVLFKADAQQEKDQCCAVGDGESGTRMCSDVRGLLGRSRRPPICGHTSSVPRHGLRGVSCLKQLPKPVCQQFDGLPQGAELPNPDYRDGSVQVKRWGTQYFHGIDRMIPGNKASG